MTRAPRARVIPLIGALLVLHMLNHFAGAQGVVIEERPDRPVIYRFELEQVEVDATVRDQVEQVQMTQIFRNPTERTIEARYLFPLSKDVDDA